MAVIKQMNIVAEAIADETIKQIYKDCDWQVNQFLSPNSEGEQINNTHSYLMRLVASQINNKLNKYE